MVFVVPKTLVFLSLYPTSDPHTGWNNHYLFRALTRQWDGRVVAVDRLRLEGPLRYMLGARKLLNRRLRGYEQPVFVSAPALHRCGGEVRRSLHELQPDLVVANEAFLLRAVAPTSTLPMMVHSDATVRGLQRIGGYEDWDPRSVDRFVQAEREGLRNAQVVTTTSHWAAEDYVRTYGLEPDRIQVIPVGANIDDRSWRIRPEEEENRASASDILFFGRDWLRKGGELAREVVWRLRQDGHPSRLVVVGPRENPAPGDSSVLYMGRLKKDDPVSVDSIRSAALRCAFLLLPTRTDCSPCAVAEAAALGLPALTSDVGGLSDTVMPGVTGYCLPIDAPVEAWYAASVQMLKDGRTSGALSRAALSHYDEAMNWDYIAHAMLARVGSSVGAARESV
jgi:glycosyltransferase involved in cell wall biosynthesis